MGRIGISVEEVHQAILKLQSIPRSISVDNIREVLGTGSKSTIARFLREWKVNNGVAAHEPNGLPAELASVVTGLWNQVQATAAQDIAAHQEAAQRDIQAALQQYQEERRQRETLENQNHTLDETLFQQRADYLKLQQAHQHEQLEKERLLERIQSLDLNITQHETEQMRLHQLLKHMQHNLEHYQNAIVAQHEEQTLLMEKQRHEAEQIRRELQQQFLNAQQQQAHSIARLEALEQQKLLVEQDCEAQRQQHAQFQQQYHDLQTVHHTLQHTLQQLQQQFQEQYQQLQQQSESNSRLEMECALTRNQIQDSEKQLNYSQQLVETLREENLNLLQQKAHLEGRLQQYLLAL